MSSSRAKKARDHRVLRRAGHARSCDGAPLYDGHAVGAAHDAVAPRARCARRAAVRGQPARRQRATRWPATTPRSRSTSTPSRRTDGTSPAYGVRDARGRCAGPRARVDRAAIAGGRSASDGGSMHPALCPGDIAIVVRRPCARAGDVVLLDSAGPARCCTASMASTSDGAFVPAATRTRRRPRARPGDRGREGPWSLSSRSAGSSNGGGGVLRAIR